MKFQPETQEGANLVSRQEPGKVWIGPTPYTDSILVPWRGTIVSWGVSRFEDLTAEHFERIAALSPEVVIFGSGSRLRFPKPALLRPLIDRRIGIETMDTAAAARTYNVLVSELRSALGALLLEAP